MRAFAQATLRIWRAGQDPSTDEPFEEFGIVQPTLEETIAFVKRGLEVHWRGECACQKRKLSDLTDEELQAAESRYVQLNDGPMRLYANAEFEAEWKRRRGTNG